MQISKIEDAFIDFLLHALFVLISHLLNKCVDIQCFRNLLISVWILIILRVNTIIELFSNNLKNNVICPSLSLEIIAINQRQDVPCMKTLTDSEIFNFAFINDLFTWNSSIHSSVADINDF